VRRESEVSRLQFVKSNASGKIDIPRTGAANAETTGLSGAKFINPPATCQRVLRVWIGEREGPALVLE